MTQMSSEMQGLGRAIASSAPDAAAVADHAGRIAALAADIERLFPKGSGPGAGPATHARNEIWRHPVEFRTQAQGLLDAAQTLENAAKAGNLSDLRSQAMAIDAVCVGCHRDFRDQ